MVEVNGRPIVEHHLAWLRANGIERVFLLTGYMHEVIAEHFTAQRIEGLAVSCIAEASPLGRGGAYKNGYREAGLSDPAVIATNGDVLTDQPLAPLVEAHERSGALATVLLTPMISPFGIVETDGGLVTGFREKPPSAVLGQRRCVRSYAGGDRPLPRRGRPRDGDVPRAGFGAPSGGVRERSVLEVCRIAEGPARGGGTPGARVLVGRRGRLAVLESRRSAFREAALRVGE